VTVLREVKPVDEKLRELLEEKGILESKVDELKLREGREGEREKELKQKVGELKEKVREREKERKRRERERDRIA
jgi:Skp family chaperone for outer membrane proteins